MDGLDAAARNYSLGLVPTQRTPKPTKLAWNCLGKQFYTKRPRILVERREYISFVAGFVVS